MGMAQGAPRSQQGTTFMQYAILIYGDESGMGHATPEQLTEMSGAYAAYTKSMHDSGVWLAGERLKPIATASSIRTRDGKTEVQDGPYADTKEQFAGFYLIDAPDLDAALAWGAKCPGTLTGTVEVRPIWMMSEYLSNG
jgi:hypothetical protein